MYKISLIRERNLRMTPCTSVAGTTVRLMLIRNRDRASYPCTDDSLNGKLLTTGFGSTAKTSSNSSVEIHTPNWEAAKSTGLWSTGYFGSVSSRFVFQSTYTKAVAFSMVYHSWLHGASGWHSSRSCLVCFRQRNHLTTAPNFWRVIRIIRCRLGNGSPSCSKSVLSQSLTSRYSTGFYYTQTRSICGIVWIGGRNAVSFWTTLYPWWPYWASTL